MISSSLLRIPIFLCLLLVITSCCCPGTPFPLPPGDHILLLSWHTFPSSPWWSHPAAVLAHLSLFSLVITSWCCPGTHFPPPGDHILMLSWHTFPSSYWWSCPTDGPFLAFDLNNFWMTNALFFEVAAVPTTNLYQPLYPFSMPHSIPLLICLATLLLIM